MRIPVNIFCVSLLILKIETPQKTYLQVVESNSGNQEGEFETCAATGLQLVLRSFGDGSKIVQQ